MRPDTEDLAPKLRAVLETLPGDELPITYRALADRLGLVPPGVIARVTGALETLMREDAAAGRPFIAALAVSRARGGLPGPGFFELAVALGRFPAAPEQQAGAFAAEQARALAARRG